MPLKVFFPPKDSFVRNIFDHEIFSLNISVFCENFSHDWWIVRNIFASFGGFKKCLSCKNENWNFTRTRANLIHSREQKIHSGIILFEPSSFVVRQVRSWRDRWKRFFMDYTSANGDTDTQTHTHDCTYHDITQKQQHELLDPRETPCVSNKPR
jgi:hypothetical protein